MKDDLNGFISTLITKGGTRKTSILFGYGRRIWLPKMRKRLRYITPSLPQFSKIGQVILRTAEDREQNRFLVIQEEAVSDFIYTHIYVPVPFPSTINAPPQ